MASIDVKKYEYESNQENQPTLTDSQALALARLFNIPVSLIIDASIQSLTKEELQGMLLISTGAQIDGSWRNRIGEEAEKVVQRLFVNEAKERGLLSALP
jgi:cobyrinic acid a,c-diamide synthase